MSASPLYGAIEAGGTKFVCAVASSAGDIVRTVQFPTGTPEEAMRQIVAFYADCAADFGAISALGIGSFGPLQLNRAAPNYGSLLATPKAGWSHFNIMAELERQLNVPVIIDTDVNCALFAEWKIGAGRGIDNLIYLTIGTGIGGGMLVNGRIAYGYSHPEMGHMLLPRLPEDQTFEGNCPFHGAQCAEGLAAGPAIIKRVNSSLTDLGADHPVWKLEAQYLAMLCMNLMLVTATQKIILGGGVMKQSHLFPKIRAHVATLLAGYVDMNVLGLNLETFIVPTPLEGLAGIKGAMLMAQEAFSADVQGKSH